MMKYMFALVLLQLCYGSNSNMNLNKEIVQSLKGLQNRVNLTDKIQILVPDNSVDLSHCVGFFSENLRNLLGNVTVKSDGRSWPRDSLLQTLDANLIELGQGQEKDNIKCKTKPGTTLKKAFGSYITYLRKLNNKK